MQCEDTQELITALVDNELTAEERRTIENHLGECEHCRSRHAQELLVKRQIRLASEAVTAPAGLRDWVRKEVEKTAAEGRPAKARSLRNWLIMPVLRPALALLLVAVVVVPLAYLWWSAKNIALTALEIHENIVQGIRPFPHSSDPAALTKRLVQAVGNRFAPMGYDLSGMNIHPVGGFVQKIAGRDVLITVYQGQGPTVTCFTFLGSEADAPKSARVVYDPDKRMNFYAFSRGSVHGVLHREGTEVCILVSDMPMAELLAMVREKARPA